MLAASAQFTHSEQNASSREAGQGSVSTIGQRARERLALEAAVYTSRTGKIRISNRRDQAVYNRNCPRGVLQYSVDWNSQRSCGVEAVSNADDDFVLIESPLSGPFRRDGIEVDVRIYRGEQESSWVLEVVDQASNSFVWDEQFPNDQAAMDEFLKSVEQEGMKQYNPHYRSGVH